MSFFIQPIAGFFTSILDPHAYITDSETSREPCSSEQGSSPIAEWYDARQTATPSSRAPSDAASGAVRQDDSAQSHKTAAGRRILETVTSRQLQDPQKFVAALHKAVELSVLHRSVVSEAEDLTLQARQEYYDLDLKIIEFKRLPAKRDESLEWRRQRLEHDIKISKEALQGGSSRLARLERANIKTTQVVAELEDNYSRILQCCQPHVDASRSTGYIGDLKVDFSFCHRLVEFKEFALQVAEAKRYVNSAQHRYAETLRLSTATNASRSTAAKLPAQSQGNEQGSKDVQASRLEAQAKFLNAKAVLELRKTTQQQLRRTLLRDHIIPALQKSQLLDEAVVIPGQAVPSPISSAEDLSPLRGNAEPAETNAPEGHPLQQSRTDWRKELERHIDLLDEFKKQYRDEHETWLCTYSEDNEEAWQAHAVAKFGKSYEAVCAEGQGYIDAARQQLDQATDRVLAAGLKVPPSPPFNKENHPAPDKHLRRRIRKHQRGVARGKAGSVPTTPPSIRSIRTGSSVRNLQSNESFGVPFKDVVEDAKRTWHRKQAELRLETAKQREKKP